MTRRSVGETFAFLTNLGVEVLGRLVAGVDDACFAAGCMTGPGVSFVDEDEMPLAPFPSSQGSFFFVYDAYFRGAGFNVGLGRVLGEGLLALTTGVPLCVASVEPDSDSE